MSKREGVRGVKLAMVKADASARRRRGHRRRHVVENDAATPGCIFVFNPNLISLELEECLRVSTVRGGV